MLLLLPLPLLPPLLPLPLSLPPLPLPLLPLLLPLLLLPTSLPLVLRAPRCSPRHPGWHHAHLPAHALDPCGVVMVKWY